MPDGHRPHIVASSHRADGECFCLGGGGGDGVLPELKGIAHRIGGRVCEEIELYKGSGQGRERGQAEGAGTALGEQIGKSLKVLIGMGAKKEALAGNDPAF